MRGRLIVAALLSTAQVLVFAAGGPLRAEDAAAPAAAGQPASLPSAPPAATTTTPATEQTAIQQTAAEPQAAPSAAPAPAAAAAAPVDAVVAAIRLQLADPAWRKDANADDVAALVAFYGATTGGPLWMTPMGFSAKGQAALFEIEKADDWGLAAAAFALPQAGDLPASLEARGTAEIKLDLAILKYARFARGGRLNPSEVSPLYDQAPPVRDPNMVLTEIAAADAPDVYLRSLHPKHEQFERLRQALLKARGTAEDGKPVGSEHDIRRLVINMERWRWMPEDLGSLYVWNNSPEFMLYVVKDGKPIYADKTLVGTSAYATPVFTADMKTVVFNPDWVAPETVVTENLLPPLREGSYSILKIHKLSVSYQGNPVDPSRVTWSRGNILNYTFSQRAGPENVLGKVKFLFPNKHTVYMHDTLPVRKKYFQKPARTIGHECVRMEKPQLFAQTLLAEDKGWPASQVKEHWDKGVNDPVAIEHKIPVHMVYFTAVADETGKVATYADVYGLDNKLATALFGNAAGFPLPPPDTSTPPTEEADASSSPSKRTSASNDIAGSLGGFAGD
jgi:murein L,D-transpeptidase YcbB/YkuD